MKSSGNKHRSIHELPDTQKGKKAIDDLTKMANDENKAAAVICAEESPIKCHRLTICDTLLYKTTYTQYTSDTIGLIKSS